MTGILVLVLFGVTQRLVLGSSTSADLSIVGVPLDDVYIHARFAKNLLDGFSYSFTPGFTLTADTSPLWVLLVGLGGMFTSRLELVSVVLSAISYLLIGVGIYRVSRDLLNISEYLSRIAGFGAILSSRLAWSGMSGMETALATLVMLLALEEHLRSRARECVRPREAVWLGVGLLLRPEFFFIIVIFLIDWGIAHVRRKTNLSAAPIALLLLITIASPGLFLPLITRGSIFSHSSVVQGAEVSFLPNLRYLWFAAKILGSNNIILFFLFIFGFYFLRNREHASVLYIIALGLPVVQAFVAPQFRHHGRYFFPVLPLILLGGIAVWNELRGKFGRPWQTLMPVLVLLAGFIETCRWAGIEAESVRNINDQHLAVVNWLRQNRGPTDTLAVDDVGAIGYFLNTPVIDLTGLVTPAIWKFHRNQDSVWNFARAHGANVFVIYRRLNPPFFDRHRDDLKLERDFPVRLPLTSSADTVMSIYRLRGTNGP